MMKIGILGGGQLSRMLALAGIPLGFEFAFYEPNAEHCVPTLGTVIQKPYSDIEALAAFVDACDVITYENENIPVETATLIAKLKPLHPNVLALKSTQDRLLEKTMFDKLNIQTVPFQKVDSMQDLQSFVDTHAFPVVIKKRRQGYDGKGQLKLSNKEDFALITDEFLSNCIVEAYITFDREVSMIAVRSTRGDCRYYDICENEHRKGVLHQTFNKINDSIFDLAKQYIDRIFEELNYVGCLAFEFFQKGDQLFANELAPRVHNSGHWTLEGAHTSQFENHIRAITDFSLGKTESVSDYQMINLLGKIPNKADLLSFEYLHLHDYQKRARAGRKVGHLCLPVNSTTQAYSNKLLSVLSN